MIDLRRLLVVLFALAAVVCGIFCLAGFLNPVDWAGGGVVAAGAAVLFAHL